MKTIKKCVEFIQERIDLVPEVAVILGSGLGAFADEIKKVGEVQYSDIPGFPQSTVVGHAGRFVFGYVGEVPVVIMQGRVHYYEGYAMSEVVLPIRVMHELGAKKLILSNAAGGVNLEFQAGDLMMITDHISSFVPSPLIGKNLDELGPRFPDMTDVYDKEVREVVKEVALSQGIHLQEGVYVQLSGPNYETPAEIRMLTALGADAVGMSTVCEAMVANHMGMKICGISCITNMASGLSDQQLSHEEVQETADRVADTYRRLIGGIIEHI
ncbi:MAG: purine-nucleoside phosphorylase [Eubacteriales bacterium]